VAQGRLMERPVITLDPVSLFHAFSLDRGSIGYSFFHGGIGTPLALIGEMAEHPGQCLGPAVMGAPSNREAQHGFQNVDLLMPILGQLGYGVDQRVLDSFNLLLRLHGRSPQSASYNGFIRESLQTIKVAGSANSSLGRAMVK
jgi:hypothetical protein